MKIFKLIIPKGTNVIHPWMGRVAIPTKWEIPQAVSKGSGDARVFIFWRDEEKYIVSAEEVAEVEIGVGND